MLTHALTLSTTVCLLASCSLTPAQKQEPTRVANDLASKALKAIEPGSRSSVFPAKAKFPSTQPLPASVVQVLPARVKNLPQNRIMTVGDVVSSLGLDPYRDRVSSNWRWNTYYVFLNDHQVLYLICDPASLKERVPSGPATTRWNAVVTEVQLRQNPNVTVTTRPLPAPLR